LNVIFHQKWSESHVTGTWLWSSPVTLAVLLESGRSCTCGLVSILSLCVIHLSDFVLMVWYFCFRFISSVFYFCFCFLFRPSKILICSQSVSFWNFGGTVCFRCRKPRLGKHKTLISSHIYCIFNQFENRKYLSYLAWYHHDWLDLYQLLFLL
jgi:hypothetical protein